MVRIVLLDKLRLSRKGLRRLLEEDRDLEVIAEGTNEGEGLMLVQQHHPDVFLFETRIPGMDGVSIARELRNLNFRVPSIAIIAPNSLGCWSILAAEGVLGFLLKASSEDELFSAVHSVHNGEPYMAPSMSSQVLLALNGRQEVNNAFDTLTPREKEILYWVAQGESDAELAQRMTLSVKTVKHHVSSLLNKLDVSSRTRAAALAWQMGFAMVPPGTKKGKSL